MFAGAVAVAVLAFPGCSKKSGPDPDVLAKVGSREIRTADLRAEIERLKARKRAIPDRETLLNELIEHEVMLQRARAASLDTDPHFKREVENLLVGKLIDREVTPRLDAVTVTTAEARAEYEKNPGKYTRPPKVRLALLFLEAGAKASETKRAEVRARIEEARRRASEPNAIAAPSTLPPGFGALAIDYSDDQASRYRGGDIGWLDAGTFPPRWPKPVLEAGYALAKGAVSEIIDTPAGFYLVMKTDARDATITPFEQAEPALRQALLLQKRRDLDAAFRAESRKLAGVTIHSSALRAADLPAEATMAQAGAARPPALPLMNRTGDGK